MRKRLIALFVVMMVGLWMAGQAEATNGYHLTGLGATNTSLGGAGVAVGLDGAWSIINPAGLTEISQQQASLGFELFSPDRNMSTRRADNTTIFGAAIGNNVRDQRSDERLYPVPFASLVYPVDKDLTLSFGLYGLSGMGVAYDKPRISDAFRTGGVFDTFTTFARMAVAPAVGYRLTKDLSIGFAPMINMGFFASDMAVQNSLNQFVETRGRGRTKTSLGINLNAGLLYKLDPQWSFGLDYQTRAWMEEYGAYKDLIPGFYSPQQMTLGTGYRPTKDLLIVGDVKWINWEGVPLMANRPFHHSLNQRGFGWRDQYVFMIGSQYQATKNLRMSAGYNYGASPIPDKYVFANALFPAIVEHHLMAGLGYDLTKTANIALTYMHAFKNSQTDNGRDKDRPLPPTAVPNGPVGIATKGAKIEMFQNSVDLLVTFKF